MDPASAPVLVTGATSFVGSAIIARLLASGYRVHATYRPQSTDKLPPFADRLQLFEAHLDRPSNSFARAAAGCAFAVHAAFPAPDDGLPVADMVKASVNGTCAVLDACANAGIKHIVFVSSHAAITQNGTAMDSKIFSESDWNNTSSRKHLPAAFAKTEAERAAWKWAQQHDDVRLVVVNPAFIWGRSLIPGCTVGAAKQFLVAIAAGDLRGVLDMSMPIVHVRDVATVIVRLLFLEDAPTGRYIICSDDYPVHVRDMVNSMTDMGLNPPALDLTNPTFSRCIKLASHVHPGGTQGQFLRANLGVHVRLSNAKLRSHLPDMQFADLEETTKETIYELIDLGLIKHARPASAPGTGAVVHMPA